MENVFVQIFETVLNVEYNVVVTRDNKSINLILDGIELDNFIKTLSDSTIVEYPEVITV